MAELTVFDVCGLDGHVLERNRLFWFGERLLLWFNVFLLCDLGFDGSLIAVNFWIWIFWIFYYLTLFYIVITKVSHQSILGLFSHRNLRSHLWAFNFLHVGVWIGPQRFRFILICWFIVIGYRWLPYLGLHSGDWEGLILFEYKGAVFLWLFGGEELLHLVHKHGIGHDIFHVMENLLYFIRVGSIAIVAHEGWAVHWGLWCHELV